MVALKGAVLRDPLKKESPLLALTKCIVESFLYDKVETHETKWTNRKKQDIQRLQVGEAANRIWDGASESNRGQSAMDEDQIVVSRWQMVWKIEKHECRRTC